MPYKDKAQRNAKARANYAAKREQFLVYHKAWRDANHAHLRAYQKRYRGARGPEHRKDRYGLTPEAFNALLASQDGRCAICRCEPSGTGPMHTLHVDHDHETGEVRALLCQACNKGLGYFKDNPALLSKAAFYVQLFAARRRESA